MRLGGGIQHAVEGGAADAQDLRGAQLIAVAGQQDRANVLLDDVLETHHAGLAALVWRRLGRAAEDGFQVRGFKDGFAFQQSAALEEAFRSGIELGKVTGPGEPTGGFKQIGRELGRGGSGLRGHAIQNLGEELRNIFAAVAKGWDDDAQSSEAVCQLRGETVGADQRAQAALGKGDDPRRLGAKLAYQVQEHILGAAWNALRAGEIAHPFAGQGVVRIRPAEKALRLCGGEDDEGTIFDGRELVQETGGSFFSTTALAGEQGRPEVRSDAADLAAQLGDDGAGSIQPERRGRRLRIHLRRWKIYGRRWIGYPMEIRHDLPIGRSKRSFSQERKWAFGCGRGRSCRVGWSWTGISGSARGRGAERGESAGIGLAAVKAWLRLHG